MKKLTKRDVSRYANNKFINKVNNIDEVDYNIGASMIGYNNELRVELWLIDNNYLVFVQKNRRK